MSNNGDEIRKKSEERFITSFKEMIDLMQSARTIEIHMRLVLEFAEHDTYWKNRNIKELENSKFISPRRSNTDKIIRELFPEKSKKYIKIREILDAVVHSDYNKTIKLVDIFLKNNEMKNEVNDEPYNFMKYENIRGNNNEQYNIEYSFKKSKENMILENYLLFKHQGYKDVVIELLNEFKESIDNLVENLPRKYYLTVLKRGLIRGEKKVK